MASLIATTRRRKGSRITQKKKSTKKTRRNRKIKKGGNNIEQKSLLDYLKSGMDVKEIANKLVKTNYKGLFENGEGEIKNPGIFQITFKDSDGDLFPIDKDHPINICFIRYAPNNDGIIDGIISHYRNKETKKCPGRGYENYYYFDEELATEKGQNYLMNIEYLDLVDKIKEREISMVKELPTINDAKKDISQFLGGKNKKK